MPTCPCVDRVEATQRDSDQKEKMFSAASHSQVMTPQAKLSASLGPRHALTRCADCTWHGVDPLVTSHYSNYSS